MVVGIGGSSFGELFLSTTGAEAVRSAKLGRVADAGGEPGPHSDVVGDSGTGANVEESRRRKSALIRLKNGTLSCGRRSF